MRTKYTIFLISFLLSCSSVAFADRQLERAEILEIFQRLTNKPITTWIPAGTIEATHEEYKAPKVIDTGVVDNQIREDVRQYQRNSDKRELTQGLQKMKLDAIPFNTRYRLSNSYTMTSAVTVRFDGDRFYWEINVDSRTDSVLPGKNLEGNYMTEQFDLNWNARRIFVWDGEEYTAYYLPGNHAIVDTIDMKPHSVHGPLTAGITPWGYGYYTYENLSAADSYAFEKYVDGQRQIHLTLSTPDDLEMFFIMDPLKNYAVLSCSITGYNEIDVSKHYLDYQLIAGNWVPSVILLEEYEAGSDRLLASDSWDITNIDTNVPESHDFEVIYEEGALVEYFSFVTDKSVMYQYSNIIDTDQLLADRLAFAANEGLQPQNCATAALKYVIDLLGKDVTDKELACLVSGPNKTTNLYQMKLFAQGMGFYCKAIKADTQTLKNIGGCEVILHIPGREHFVVVDDVGKDFISIVDLASNNFYYRTDLDFFSMDWTEGTALLISDSVIEGKYSEIDDEELTDITGGTGYRCNILRQNAGYINCLYISGLCLGTYRHFYERWGCGPAESGSCSQYPMIRFEVAPCLKDSEPFSCTEGDETAYYMMACPHY